MIPWEHLENAVPIQAVPKVDSRKIEAFLKVLEARPRDSANGFGKAYLRMLVDEIRLEGNDLKKAGQQRETR